MGLNGPAKGGAASPEAQRGCVRPLTASALLVQPRDAGARPALSSRSRFIQRARRC
ncbi:hypothetical protein BN2476_90034 [Paraburkholderia piptadeniae]|uniref:Uncharacterized protein n=1 Tax=Paraburkholderia piptadeniae TaxID=1701573 RepID=A0A1N7RMN8_9BURK|nr:hypothetical protein BN2476_90034 [Paraburkholderia piptadeniae]